MSVGEEKSGALDGGSVGRRRRRWSDAQKRQIVAETHEPGVSVPMVAQRYNLNANQIFRWRRLFRELERAGGAGRFVPVVRETRTIGQRMFLQHRAARQHSAVDGGHGDGVDRRAVEFVEQVWVLD